jgi:branched-chain amino acid transport system substrate-binding protein
MVYQTQVSLAQPDYTSECLQAQSKGVQTFLIIVDANSVERFTHSCLQQGYHPQFVAISLALTQGVASDPDANGVGSGIATFPWMQNDLPAEQIYHAAIKQYDAGLEESASSSAVWLAGQMLLAASKNLPANNPTSQDFYNGLYQIKNNTFGGLATYPVTFTQGRPSTDSNCYFFVQSSNGHYQTSNGSNPVCL